MGTTTLKTRRKHLAALCLGIPANRELSTNDQTEVDYYIGQALRYVYNFNRWGFLDTKKVIELEAAYDTGTVSVTGGATSWTGTGTTWDTGWSGGIKIRSGQIYRVASIDSTTGITSTDAAIETLTDADYSIYIDEVSLGLGVETIESLSIPSLNDRRLNSMTPSEMADHKARGALTGDPGYFCDRGEDSNGYRMIELYPVPGANVLLHVTYYAAGTVPTADGATDDVPTRWSDVVDERAKMLLYEYRSDPRYQGAQQRFSEMILRMMQQESIESGLGKISLDPSVHGPRIISGVVQSYEI